MPETSKTSNSRSSEVGLFNQIAMFSAGGLAISMALVLVDGFPILYPWF